MPSYTESIGSIFKFIDTGWQGCSSIRGYVPKIYWEGYPYDTIPDPSLYYLIVSSININEHQISIGLGNKTFDNKGEITLTIMCPKSAINSKNIGRKYLEFIKGLIRGSCTQEGVIFRNSRIKEVFREDGSNSINCIIYFDYTDYE